MKGRGGSPLPVPARRPLEVKCAESGRIFSASPSLERLGHGQTGSQLLKSTVETRPLRSNFNSFRFGSSQKHSPVMGR